MEAGSFAAAALGLTRAAVSKQIAALEERIGAPAQPHHPATQPTGIGAEFYPCCARIAEEAEGAVASLQGARVHGR